jgi:hypothetical protein
MLYVYMCKKYVFLSLLVQRDVTYTVSMEKRSCNGFAMLNMTYEVRAVMVSKTYFIAQCIEVVHSLTHARK